MSSISKNIVVFIITFASFIILDCLFIHFVVSDFYKKSLQHHLNIVNNKVAIRLVPGALVYLVLAAALMFFVYDHALSLTTNALRAAFFGFTVYAVYDLTNMATLSQWPVAFTIVDIAWGTVVSTLVTVITLVISQKML